MATRLLARTTCMTLARMRPKQLPQETLKIAFWNAKVATSVSENRQRLLINAMHDLAESVTHYCAVAYATSAMRIDETPEINRRLLMRLPNPAVPRRTKLFGFPAIY